MIRRIEVALTTMAAGIMSWAGHYGGLHLYHLDPILAFAVHFVAVVLSLYLLFDALEMVWRS